MGRKKGLVRKKREEVFFHPRDDGIFNQTIIMEEAEDRLRMFMLGNSALTREDARELGTYLVEWGSGE